MSDEDQFDSVQWDTGARDSVANPLHSSQHGGFAEHQDTSGHNRNEGSDSHTVISKTVASPSTKSSRTVLDEKLITIVSDPQKELEGSKDAFVSYLVTTETKMTAFGKSPVSVRRRFQDFYHLHEVLARDFPACIIPPIPDKHRMEYITGDRFSQEFLSKRCASLDRFVKRISRHPTLRKAHFFHHFLQSTEWQAELASQHKKPNESVFDNIGDSLMNALTKLKKTDERFIDIRESVGKLDDHLETVERLCQRTLKRQSDLYNDYEDFAASIEGLGELETGITEQLNSFANTVMEYAKALKTMNEQGETAYLTEIRDYLALCASVKSLLKSRDQKQLDFEELSEMLQNTVMEREKLAMNRTQGLASYLREKVDDIRGLDQERVRQERIRKLDSKIAELQEAVENSHDVSQVFSDNVVDEYEIFQQIKSQEMRESLLDYTQTHIEFFKQGINEYMNIIPLLEGIKVQV